MNLSSNSFLCTFGSLFQQFFSMAYMSWNFIISISLVSLIKNPFRQPTKMYTWMAHGYVWTLSTITSLILLFDLKNIGRYIS